MLWKLSTLSNVTFFKCASGGRSATLNKRQSLSVFAVSKLTKTRKENGDSVFKWKKGNGRRIDERA